MTTPLVNAPRLSSRQFKRQLQLAHGWPQPPLMPVTMAFLAEHDQVASPLTSEALVVAMVNLERPIIPIATNDWFKRTDEQKAGPSRPAGDFLTKDEQAQMVSTWHETFCLVETLISTGRASFNDVMEVINRGPAGEDA